MFDFNCDVAQSYGIYKNDSEFDLAPYVSSINISAGFHAGDPINIRRAFMFAKEHDIALGAHIGYPDIQGFGRRKMDLDKDELEAIVIYQIGAIVAYAKTFDLEIENVRCHGALKDAVNESEQVALIVAEAIKKVSPWLNLIVQKQEIKELILKTGLKSALEVDFSQFNSVDELQNLERSAEVVPDTIHVRMSDDINMLKEAYELIKPTPINYNRVESQI